MSRTAGEGVCLALRLPRRLLRLPDHYTDCLFAVSTNEDGGWSSRWLTPRGRVVSLRPSHSLATPVPNRDMYRLAILTISSSGARGEREDTGGQAIRDKLPPPDYEEVRYEVVADDADSITGRLIEWADSGEVDLIVSTGGTGMGRRDVTPEAALRAMDRQVPGMAETMRAQTLKFTPMAMLSRSVVGIRGRTLIITLPGSPRGVGECLDVILPVLPHAIELLQRESVQDHPR